MVSCGTAISESPFSARAGISCFVMKMWLLSFLFGSIGAIFIVLCTKMLEHTKKERNPEKRKIPEENEERFLDQ